MKKILLMLMAIAGWLSIQAQTDSTTKAKKNTFIIGVTATNNASYYGQRVAEKTPYVALVGAYKLKSGIYFSGSALRLLQDSTGVASASGLGIGYGFNIGKKLEADISYSHTFYATHSPLLQAANNNVAGASLQYKYFLTSGIGVDYTFGKQTDVFATFSTSKDIALGNLFNQKDGLSINPAIEIVGGTQRFYTTYSKEKSVRDSILNLLSLPVLGGGSNEQASNTITEVSSNFSLISYNLKLPLQYYRKHYLLEMAYHLSVLSKKAKTSDEQPNSFFNISFYYQF